MFSRVLKPVALAVSLSLAVATPALAQQQPAAAKAAPAGASAATGAAVGGITTGAVLAAVAVVAVVAAAQSGSSGGLNREAAAANEAAAASVVESQAVFASIVAVVPGVESELTRIIDTRDPLILNSAQGIEFNNARTALTNATSERESRFSAYTAANAVITGSCPSVSCTPAEVAERYRLYVDALQVEANAIARFQRAAVAIHEILRTGVGSTPELIEELVKLSDAFDKAVTTAKAVEQAYVKWVVSKGLTVASFTGVTGTVGAVATTGSIGSL